MDDAKFLRIVQAGNGDSPASTRGTELWVGDTRLAGVIRLELVAEPNDVWRAVVHCAPSAFEIISEIESVQADHAG